MSANAFPQAQIMTVRKGLLGKPGSFAQQLMSRPSGSAIGRSGNVPYTPSYITLPKIESKGGRMGLPPLVSAEDIEDETLLAEYTALAYEGPASFSDEEGQQAAAFGVDKLQDLAERAKIIVDRKEDFDFAGALSSVTKNQEYAVSTDWADNSGSPLDDLLTVKRTKVPDADTIIVGREVIDAWSLHDEFLGRLVNYSGSGGATYEDIAATIKSLFKLDLVVFDAYYNSAARGAKTIERTYLFAQGVWVGNKSGLLYVQPDMNIPDGFGGRVANDVLHTWRDNKRRATRLKWVRYSDPTCIPDPAFGCIMTGTLS